MAWGASVEGSGTRTIREPEQYMIDTELVIVDFEAVLFALDEWAISEHRITPEEAVMSIRRFNHTLKTASRACGVPVSDLEDLVREDSKCE